MPELLKALSDRRARRAFAPDPVPEEIQWLLWEAVRVAPSHGNAQPVRVLVARSEDARKRFVESLSEGNRSWAPAAPLLFAIAAIPSHDATIESADGTRREMWAFHAGIAAGNIMAQATALGLIAHPMAAFDEASARDAFGCPHDVRILAMFAVGYPGGVESLPEDLRERERGSQNRLPVEHLVAFDHWNDGMSVSARSLRKSSR